MLQLVISPFFLIFKLPVFFKTNYHFFISYGSLKFCIGVSKILKNKQTKNIQFLHTVKDVKKHIRSRGVISKICVSGTRFVCSLSNPDLCVSADVKNSLECIISVNQSKNSQEKKKKSKPQTKAPTSDRTVHVAEEQRNSSIP